MAEKKKDTLDLWNRVERTDPNHTKHVAQRGGFTAIDAMHQVKNATQEFGPVGVGWGWDFEILFPPNDTVCAVVTLWHGKRDQTVKQIGQKSLGSGRVDEDALKKAVTDGLTKCLSYLGFNADVFLGKFDDNKYVQSNVTYFEELEKPEEIVAFEKTINEATDADVLEKTYTDLHRDHMVRLAKTNARPMVKKAKNLYDTSLQRLNTEKEAAA